MNKKAEAVHDEGIKIILKNNRKLPKFWEREIVIQVQVAFRTPTRYNQNRNSHTIL
jgi:hypothetical protein